MRLDWLLNILILSYSLVMVMAEDQVVPQSRDTLPPLTDIGTILSFLVLAAVVGLAQAGGIGGGPIISPIIMALLGISSRKAIWNTYIMLFGGSIGNFLKLGSERVKRSGSPLINYKLVLVCLPLMLSGAVFGVATGKALPKLLIIIMLIGLLLQTVIKVYRQYIRLRNIERDQEAMKNKDDGRGSWVELVYMIDEYTNIPEPNVAYTFKQKQITNPSEVDFKKDIRPDQLQLTSLTTSLIFKNPKLLIIYEREKQIYPFNIIVHLVLQVFIVIMVSLLKGSKTFPSVIGFEYCSVGYQLCNLLLLIISLISITYYKAMFTKEETEKEEMGYDFSSEPRMLPLIDGTVKASFFAGFLGGFVGLGGGIILNPIWLEMGVPSSRAAASSTFCVMFTSFISFFTIWISGGYTLQDIIVFGFISSSGSYIVAGWLKLLVQKFKRDSIIIQVLIGVILFGLIILPINSGKDIYRNPQSALQFNRFC